MARPVFLSYSWDQFTEAEELDDLLRWRGVPVWRDRRNMRFGGYLEDRMREDLANECSGFALYLSREAIFGGSRFIPQIELPAMDERRSRDATFFAGAVFRDWSFGDAQKIVHEETGISVGATLGEAVESTKPLTPQLAAAANAILRAYLAAQRGPGPAEMLFDTRNEVSWREPGLLHLSWHPPLAHAVETRDGDCWENRLLPSLHDLRCGLIATAGERALKVRGTPHLSAALALGYEFRKPTGFAIEMTDAAGITWNTDHAAPDLNGWTAEPRPGIRNGDDHLVVSVHARHDIAGAVRDHRASMAPARATLDVRPPADAPTEAIDVSTASSLAAAIADAVRETARTYGTRETHLYLAGPWPMAVLLGWHLASSGPIVSYEATADRQDYRRACRLT